MTRGSSGNNNPNNPNSNFIHHSIGKSQIESVKNRAQQVCLFWVMHQIITLGALSKR